MRIYVNLLFSIFLLLVTLPAIAQPTTPQPAAPQHLEPYGRKKKDTAKPNLYIVDTLIRPIPLNRSSFHDKIDKEQKQDDLADGKADNFVVYFKDRSLSPMLTAALIKEVDKMQVMIENMPANGRDAVMDNQQKIRFLRAVWEMMRKYSTDPKADATYYAALISNMHGMLIAINENKMLDYVKANPNIYSLNNGRDLFDGQPDARAYIYTAMSKADPLMMINRLEEYATDTFAGVAIRLVARMKPDIIFNYAMSTNKLLRNAVYNTQDELVQAIVRITAHSKAPLKLIPFLSDIYYGRKTVAELDTIASHPDLYYQNLVRLKMSGDTLGKRIYEQELQYRTLKYLVRQINDLHEAKDEERFKSIDGMPATSLYYMMIYGQDEIYTSSFLGAFKRLVANMSPLKGNNLLDTLHYDHFRTFLRMCAGYNTLSAFLGTMDDTARISLLNNFVGGLQRGREDDLEDAVDVADAFGSIRDTTLLSFLHKKVKENYELSYSQRSKKGMIVYSLLAMLFESNRISGSDTGAAVASSRLHLPPINKVRYSDLLTDSTVYQQVFFYGDEDGLNSYRSYLLEFTRDKNWHVDSTNKQWTVIRSLAGRKVIIYANLPLKEPEDELAQNALTQYLASNNIRPTIMLHRGHSYHLSSTLARLNKDVKIVILGSCGGYNNLAAVLDRAPDAHIVSSKQVGATWVNEPIIKAVNARLLEGSDINWITMWRELEDYFATRPELQEKFDDYVPPYKNLGAIFIKAYRRMMSTLR